MITGDFSNTNPTELVGYLDKMVGVAISAPTARVEPNIALQIPETCCICLGVFGGGTGYQNDKTTFFYKRAISSDTITLKLKKDGVQVATITDNTYGTYYDFGTWTAHTGQEHYKVFIIDWDLVYTGLGEGVYEIDADHVIIGDSYTETSQQFRLHQYSDYRADGTTVFQWTQNGRIRGAEYNYQDMNITQYIRVDGRFASWNPSLEKDEVIYSNYERIQVQDEIINSYEFESRLVDSVISKLLINDMMLADEIIVSDFNIFNHRQDYVGLRLRQDEVSIEELAYSDKAVLNLKFTDKIKDQIKQK